MVSRQTRLLITRPPLSKETGKQERRLNLRAGDRRNILDTMQSGPCNRQRSQFSTPAASDDRSHFAQRLDDPPHRTPSDRCVARENRKKILPGQETYKKTDACSGIAAINRSAWFG